MARYIKANPLVAKFLHLEDVRNTVKDGNYLLWQADMQAFGPLSLLPETLEQIGGIVLTPHEAREEQDGTVTRPLPTATDPRFVPVATPVAPSPVEEQEQEGAEESEEAQPEESQPEGDTEPESESVPEAPAEEETPNDEQED